jgi:hypothetical protein
MASKLASKSTALRTPFLLFATLTVLSALQLATLPAQAQPEEILHSFGGQPGDGANPVGGCFSTATVISTEPLAVAVCTMGALLLS